MPVYSLGDRVPDVHPTTYVHPLASIIGDVTVGELCWVGPGASLRGDYGKIVIGSRNAIEDNVVVHARPDEVCTLGDRITLGHSCIIHNAVLHDWVIVGMGGIVSDYAEEGEWAVVAEGAVVKKGQRVPPRALAYGVPAKIKEGHIDDEYIKLWGAYKDTYAGLAVKYRPMLFSFR